METQVIAIFQGALVLAAVLAFVTYWLVWARGDEVSLTGALVKTASTGLLALLGALALGPGYATLGLALGAAGDFFLARRGEKAFLAGMAAFALGHLVYALGLAARAAEIAPVQLSTARLVVALILAGFLLSTEVWLAPRAGALRWPVRGYVLVIGLMGFVTIALPGHPENLSAAVIRLGAGLFILSDFLLALRLFVARTASGQRALSLGLWPAYWGGQALILLGASLYAAPFAA